MITFVNGCYIVDGLAMEGGGQVLRLATCLGTLTNSRVRVHNIRGNRKPPGLRPQHLKGLELMTKLATGVINGLRVGSNEVETNPGETIGGHHDIDCQTAGSVTLIMQGAFPCVLFAKKSISTFCIRGGTNVPWSPSIDYYEHVFIPIVKQFGITCGIEVIKRGFYPEGGGQVVFNVETLKQLKPIDMTEKGQVVKVWGEVFSTCNVHKSVVDGIKHGALQAMQGKFSDLDVDIKVGRYNTPKSSTTGLHLFAETSSGCRLGISEIKQQSEEPTKFGQAVTTNFLKSVFSSECVDKHLQDQIIILMALANGKSRIRTCEITSHTSTAILITTRFTKAQFKVTQDGSDFMLECDGIGRSNIYL